MTKSTAKSKEKSKLGGARPGAGRPRLSVDEKISRGTFREDRATADELRAAGASAEAIDEAFDRELWQLWGSVEVLIPDELSEAWKKLPAADAVLAEGDYVFSELARRIVAGEIKTSSEMMRWWARKIVKFGPEYFRDERPQVAAPQRCDETSEKIAEQYRLLAAHEAARKANGTFRPLSSFRAVQNAAHYTRLGAR